MRILFAISMLCFLALVWASISILRHIRSSRARTLAVPHDFSRSLFEAIDENTGRAPIPYFQVVTRRRPEPAATPQYAAAAPLPPRRKQPQSLKFPPSGQRLDHAYFNKDLGDLTDPYEAPLRVNAPRTGTSHRP